MRKIKFRAWIHKDCGGGVPLECYQTMDYSDNYQGDLSDFFELYNPLFFDVMQYTGLKDKNGKEIYEGDMLKFYNGNIEVVQFSNGSFTVFNEPLGFEADAWGIEIFKTEKWCEIIGNIHENPELIK